MDACLHRRKADLKFSIGFQCAGARIDIVRGATGERLRADVIGPSGLPTAICGLTSIVIVATPAWERARNSPWVPRRSLAMGGSHRAAACFRTHGCQPLACATLHQGRASAVRDVAAQGSCAVSGSAAAPCPEQTADPAAPSPPPR